MDETGDLHNDFVEIGVSEGLIRSDYFSSDPHHHYRLAGADGVGGVGDETSSVSSDNPSWIEPSSNPARKHSSELWSDSGSEGHDSSEVEENQDLGIGEEEKFGGSVEEEGGEGGGVVGEEKKGVVWWKVPMEVLRFCLFRVNPGWSVAVAAAVVGMVILRRRMYRMKKKGRGVSLEITVEDKTVSQFMKNAARLNEAFSVVRRVPMVRPLLPSAGITPWPILNMR